MKITFLILSVFAVFCSKGQVDTIQPITVYIESPNTPYSKISKRIDIIQKEDFDTVLSYISIKGGPPMGEDEVRGIGKVTIRGEGILIGFKKNKISCIKIIESYDGVFKSKSIDLEVDSILQNLRNEVAACETEQFLPYVCEIFADSVSIIKGFYPMQQGLHEPFCSLYLKYANKSRLKEFGFESLSEKYLNSDDWPRNLNFKYNSSLKLYKLYSFLNELFTKYEDQFDFGK